MCPRTPGAARPMTATVPRRLLLDRLVRRPSCVAPVPAVQALPNVSSGG
jgi:hypothetical protein